MPLQKFLPALVVRQLAPMRVTRRERVLCGGAVRHVLLSPIAVRIDLIGVLCFTHRRRLSRSTLSGWNQRPSLGDPVFPICIWQPETTISTVYRHTVAHIGSSVPACSAAMYAAYQSGQFASGCPLRFSCSPCAAAARRIALAKSFADAKVVIAGSMRPGDRRAS